MKPRVFVAVPVVEELQRLLSERCDLTVYAGSRPIAPDDLKVGLSAAEGVLATPLIPFPAEVIDAAPRLRAIANIGVGYDNVDLERATARGIAVANTPGVLNDAVADFVMGMIITIARRMHESAQIVREGRWGVAGTEVPLGVDLKLKTLALIGFGRIGHEVAARALAFKMRVVFFDARSELAVPPQVQRAPTLEAALRQADFVSMHVDLNPSTRRFIGSREFGWMKPGAFFVNTARGGVVDQHALCAALAERRLAGAALDVLEAEPPDPKDPILKFDNVFIVPHIGSATVETRQAMAELAVRNLIACVNGESCACIVNQHALSAD